MTYFKNYIILFGGFQDTSQQTKYLQDLWIYDCSKYTWFNPQLPPASQKPDPRSSFSFLPHESGAVLYGGYSRVKASTTGSGKQAKGPQRTVLKPMIHQDTWFLRITPPGPDAPASAGPTVRWERRKRPVNAPNPPRAGVTMAHHKGRGILFGGVHDVEASEEGIESEFFNTLYAWNLERNRFFELTLRRPKGPSKRQQSQAMKNRDRSKADEEELLRNLAALEAKKGIRREDDEDLQISQVDEEPAEPINTKIVRFEMPHPRFNAQLAVQEDTLFIFGGTYERGDQEFIFNDLYSIDLARMDGVKEIFYNEPLNWNNKEEESEDEEDEEDESEEESDKETEVTEDVRSMDTGSVASTELTVPSVTQGVERLDVDDPAEPEPTVEDNRPHPRPFESLRDFFARTSTEWQNILIERLKAQGQSVEKTPKELRKEAFDLAEEKWWDSREEIMALEDEQEAAGIGEVVNIAEKGDGAVVGGAARRR